MPRISFTDWLIAQTGRLDAVGDLATSYEADAEVAPRAITVAEVRQRLTAVGATPDYHSALDEAALEYASAA